MPNIANISGNLLTDSGIDLSTLPSGSGTLNYLPKWTSSSALGNSLVFDNGTSVGIGTTSPSYRLDVNGNAQIGGTVSAPLTSHVLINPTATSTVNSQSFRCVTINPTWNQGGFGNSTIYALEVYKNARFFDEVNGLQLTIDSNNVRASTSFKVGGLTIYNDNTIYYPTGGMGFASSNTFRAGFTGPGNFLLGSNIDGGEKLQVTGTARITGDANINGLTVGKGGGSVATNTAVGSSALNANTTGSLNVAVGTNALQSNVTGVANTAIGYQALNVNNAAANNGANVSVGYWSGLQNVSGTSNTYIGAESGRYQTSGSQQTAIGFRSLWGATGATNIAIGYQTAQDLTTGSNNIIIGGQTTGVTTGSNNTLIGAVSGLSASLSNTIILADGQGNQRLYINNSGNVGIGTTSPNTLLHIQKDQNSTTAFTLQNSTNGTGSNIKIELLTNGGGTGVIQKYSPTTSSFKMLSALDFILYNSPVGGDISMLNDNTTGRIKFAAGASSTSQMTLFSNGNLGVGVGTTDAGYKLDVNGTANISGATRIFDANLTMQKGAATGDQRISFRYGGTEYGYVGVNTSSGVAFFGSDTYGVSINTASAISCNGTLRVQSATVSGISPGFQIRNGGNIYFENYVDWGAVAGIIQTPSNYDLRLRTGTNNGILIAKTSGNVTIDANTFLATTSGSVGIGTTSPNASALLDVSSNTKGFLPPRMTGANAEAIGTPAAGLLVYINNGNGTTITSTGWWGYDGTTWVKLN